MAPRAKLRARRRALIGLAGTIVLLGVLLFAVFPTRSWWEQRQETSAAEAELAEVREQREKVEQEQQLLLTDEEIERRAREEYGYVMPGEDVYNILPPPADPIGLPEGWPFIGVERVFGAR